MTVDQQIQLMEAKVDTLTPEQVNRLCKAALRELIFTDEVHVLGGGYLLGSKRGWDSYQKLSLNISWPERLTINPALIEKEISFRG